MDSALLARMPSFKQRMEWFIQKRSHLTGNIACIETTGEGERRRFSIVDENKLCRILRYMLDGNEFLSPFGIRPLSKYHEEHPYVLGGMEHRVDYQPGESRTGVFGGNSNRREIWFPMNFLIVEALQRRWRRFEVSIGRMLARFDSLLRVFSWRHGRESPDRLDRAGHETDSAQWSQRAKLGGHCKNSGCGRM